jgi:flagella basal body P-ring formation protein FlgA
MIPPVRRGDWVQASLTMTSAKLSFDAVAEMDGVEGQSVFIKRDGRRLRARVSGAGAVQVLSRDTQ